MTSIPALAEGLSEAQRKCGDVLDRLPCLQCGATTLRACTLPMADRAAASRLINDNPGLHNHLLALQSHLRSAKG